MAKAKKKVEAPVAEGAPVGEETVAEDTGLITVRVKGDKGQHKALYANGVMTASYPCGEEVQVTPEAAELMRQCSII